MASNDPFTLIYSLYKEYTVKYTEKEKDEIEKPVIFEEFEKRVPKFDEKQKRFCDLENQKDSRIFYIQLMKLINNMYEKDSKANKAKQVFIEKLSGTLSKNPKHFNCSVVSEEKVKTVVPSSEELCKKLTSLANKLIEGASDGSRVSTSHGKSREGSISNICSLLKEINKSLSLSEKEVGSLSRRKLIDLINELPTDELCEITKLISEVAIHNKIRDYFYNAGIKKNNKKATQDKTTRNKTIYTLEHLERKVALPVSKVAKLTDDEKIESSMEKLLEDNKTSTFIPVTSDCFGNVIIIAGLSKLTAKHAIESYKANKACRYIIMKQAFQNNLTHDKITLTLPDKGECVFDDYKLALNALQFVTTEHINKIREKYYDYLPKDVFDAHDLEELMQLEDIRKQKDKLKKEWLKEM